MAKRKRDSDNDDPGTEFSHDFLSLTSDNIQSAIDDIPNTPDYSTTSHSNLDVDDDANNNANDDDDYSVGELLANDDDDDRRSNDGDSVMSFDSQLSRLSQFTPIPPPMITPTPRTPIPPIVVTHAEENLDGYLPQNYSNDVIDADDLLVHDNDTNSEFSF